MGNTLQGHTDSVFSVAFSLDGRYIVSGSTDQTIQVWDAQKGTPVGNPLQGHTDSVTSVAFSSDGRHIVSGSDDQTIRVWDVQAGCQVGSPLQGHTSWVSSVAFSPDGRHIVSGSGDQTIRVWVAQTGGQVGNPLQGHTSRVSSVSFSPDGRHIVSGSADQTIRVWDAQTGSGHVGANGPIIQLPPIKFSSSTMHALTHTQSLFANVFPDVDGNCQDLVHFLDDGWIVGPNGELLLWVPHPYHSSFKYTPCTNLIIPKGFTELDLSRMCHGSIWHKCYSSVCMAT